MLPLAATAAAVPVVINYAGRLGPYLGRLAAANPSLVTDLAFRMRTAGAKSVTNIASMIDWARKNPLNAGLIAAQLAAMGHSVYALFDNPDDPDTAATIAGYERVTQNARERFEKGAELIVSAAGEKSVTASLGTAEEAAEEKSRVEAVKRTLKFADDFFGGAADARVAHRYMQAFFEMPEALVKRSFEDLNYRSARYGVDL